MSFPANWTMGFSSSSPLTTNLLQIKKKLTVQKYNSHYSTCVLCTITNGTFITAFTARLKNLLVCIELLLLRPFNGLFSRTTWVSQYHKSKTSLDSNEAKDDGGFGMTLASAGPYANNLHLAPDR